MSRNLRHIAGAARRDSAQQWRQLGTTSATVTVNFYCVEPVNGNAVLSVLTARGGVDALAWIDSATKTFYDGKEYLGPYTAIRVTSGEVRIQMTDTNG
jgi:hypothetical protein